jgi:hypothetical protein
MSTRSEVKRIFPTEVELHSLDQEIVFQIKGVSARMKEKTVLWLCVGSDLCGWGGLGQGRSCWRTGVT